MFSVFIWWLTLQIIGLVTWPLAFSLFSRLPDRGHASARPLGLLLTGYGFWLLVSFGFLGNTWSAIVFVLVLVAAASAWSIVRNGEAMRSFWREERRLILATEVLFTVAFLLWATYRAYIPAINHTEQPMDFGFLNAILASRTFPPQDPWLSGFAISYYYFGYLIMAMLTRLSGVVPGVAYNLALATLFALTITGSFSIIYNLVRGALEKSQIGNRKSEIANPLAYGLLGALFVAVIGNLEGLLEILHAKGIGSPGFWQWIDIKNLASAPPSPTWYPGDNWWWWRASRVIHDVVLGHTTEVIDEFPFFSFMLGDMHPHVLALPFGLMALALALNVIKGAIHLDTEGSLRARLAHLSPLALLYPLCLGALGFLNSWDFPTYTLIVVAAFAVHRYLSRGEESGRGWLVDAGVVAALLVGLGLVLYLPFYVSFQSQAGGILPVLFATTRLHQYLIMFGLFVFVLASYAVAQVDELLVSSSDQFDIRALWTRGLRLLVAVMVMPFVGLALILLTVVLTPRGRTFLQELQASPAVREILGGQSLGSLARQAAMLRLANPGVFILLTVLVSLVLLCIWEGVRRRGRASVPVTSNPGHEALAMPAVAIAPGEMERFYVLTLVGIGLLLTLGVEFVYIKDTFGTRMNTVFKLYYQAWVILAVSAAYGVFYVRHRLSGVGRVAWSVALGVLVVASMFYPLAAIYARTEGFRTSPTLDGTAWVQQFEPDAYAAIEWLKQNTDGSSVVLEATGGSYWVGTYHGRVSAFSGRATVLGWGGHELQWRGNYDEPGKREPDIAAIYQSLDVAAVQSLLEKYDIDYVYLGSVERQKYGLSPQQVDKFGRFMDRVFSQGDVVIYERR